MAEDVGNVRRMCEKIWEELNGGIRDKIN